MTTNYTGVNGGTFSNTTTGPAPTELVTGASVGLTAQSAANQEKYLYDKLNGVAYTDIKVKFNGRKSLRRSRVTLSDAAQTVKVSQGDRFELPDPAAPRIITLDHTIDSPVEGELLEFVAPVISGGGTQYTFRREDAIVVCTFVGSTVAATNPCYFVEFERTGGVWRMGMNSGSAYDGGAPAEFGVIPGAGA